MANSQQNNINHAPPRFTRSEVAVILNCSPLTIYNREKSGKYPSPSRSSSNYRMYSLDDLFTLQKITYGQVYLSSIMSLLWDKGYTDVPSIERYLNDALEKFKTGSQTVVTTTKVTDDE